jgi:hypothetical protein
VLGIVPSPPTSLTPPRHRARSQARTFITELPGTLKTEVPKEEAEKIVALFKGLGATVTMS